MAASSISERTVLRRSFRSIGMRADGAKEAFGLWLEQNESAKFWLRVTSELRNRGTEDILLAVVDGLKGLANARSSSERRST